MTEQEWREAEELAERNRNEEDYEADYPRYNQSENLWAM